MPSAIVPPTGASAHPSAMPSSSSDFGEAMPSSSGSTLTAGARPASSPHAAALLCLVEHARLGALSPGQSACARLEFVAGRIGHLSEGLHLRLRDGADGPITEMPTAIEVVVSE